MLDSWNDGPTKSAIVDFVGRVTAEGGRITSRRKRASRSSTTTARCGVRSPRTSSWTSWCAGWPKRPPPTPSLAEQQPYKAALHGDLRWFGDAITKHYQGDDSELKVLAGAVMSLHESMNVEDHAALIGAFFAEAKHPTLNRPYQECIYAPMVELLRYLEGHGFTCYIVSGGGRDFMRPITSTIYGIPPERVVGSAQGLKFEGGDGHGDLLIQPALDIWDDGPEKPVRIWSRIGRRPILSAGNSNGDDEMLMYSGRPGAAALRLLVLHDDADREFDYTAGAERALEHAKTYGWTVVSMKNDWTTVFSD